MYVKLLTHVCTMRTFITHSSTNGKLVFCYSESVSEYHSGSSLRQHRLRSFFVPPLLVWLLYLLISLVILTLLNINVLWQNLLGASITTADITPVTDDFSAFQDKLGTPIVMVFWLFIGALTYTIIWLAENVIFIAKTEVEESHYLYRSPIIQHRYLQTTITSNLFLFFVVLLWVSFIALYLRVLLPAFSQLFNTALFSAPIYERFIDIIAAIIGNTLAIYFILLLRRIITYSWNANRP